MNQIERLKADLARRFPEVAAEIDAPTDPRGPWFLDVRRPGNVPPVVVEWRPDRGFGVSAPDEGEADYGMGPDEVYTNAKATFERVVALILSGGPTEPPRAVRLAELRKLRGLSQEELAERAGMGQANLARIESREDVLVSTLVRILSAMGASLSIHARFPEGAGADVEIVFPPIGDVPGKILAVPAKGSPASGRANAGPRRSVPAVDPAEVAATAPPKTSRRDLKATKAGSAKRGAVRAGSDKPSES